MRALKSPLAHQILKSPDACAELSKLLQGVDVVVFTVNGLRVTAKMTNKAP